MRANWDQQESTQIAVEHQQQHPQQPIVQEAAENLVGHPLHTATTPAWDSIADGIVVKPEPLDDKNNDSGISPGHYTSASASPESGSSQDSNNLPMNTFEYSPQIMYKQCDSPLDYARVNNTIDGYGMDNQHPITSTSPSNENMMQNNCDKEGDEIEEPGLRVPLVNSQGKMKTFRCKQCDFSAITKLEFWSHTRTHIKAEKLLTCPKCPFCTEYKHHLEYHLRNHFGSKPYKCDKCSYSCVNKSMLNSHLKSHSNVYQFRCADCTYATKYCHSLKLHLRKYEHKPAMVLNSDGTPNPLPIIDVYGTRRGPKSKPKKEQEPQPANNNTLVNSLMPTVVPQQLAALGNFNFNVMNGVPNPTFNGFNGSASPTDMSMPSAPTLMGFPYHLFSGIQMLKENGQLPQFNQFASAEQQHAALPPAQPKEQMKSEPAASKAAPLDLSRPDSCENKTVIANETTPVVSSTVTPTVTGNSPKTGGTSRRKGRAFKLERRVVERESDDEAEHEKVQENDKFDDVSPIPTSPLSTDSKEFNKEPNSPHSPQSEQYSIMNMAGEFYCQYCEISFGNEVMHSVHMGYHGYQNPYTCNMCGTQCTDKVSFFLHIARFKH